MVSDSHRERILKAADDLGYRRNTMAAGIRTGKFGAIALLLSSHKHASTLPICVLEGIQSEVEARGVHLILHKLPVDTLSDPARLPKVLREWSCDGLLVDMTHAIPSSMREAIAATKLPAVWFNVPDEFDAVRPDDYEAGRQAARHILELGHRRICYMDLARQWSRIENRGVVAGEHYSAYDRYLGAKYEVEAAGLEMTSCFLPESMPYGYFEGRFEHLYQLVERTFIQHKPTAIISYSELDYVRFAVARDLGLRIPQDVSLITFGAVPSTYLQYHLTQMGVPELELGREMVRLLFQKMNDPTQLSPTVVLPFELDPGNTIGVAPL